VEASPLFYSDASTANGYSETMFTDETVTFPGSATATATTFACRPMTPPFDETLDISDIDFDALICEGSEVDWIDDCASDCETTDAESSFNSHNNSFYQHYDSEEARRPFPYSSTNSSSSNNSNNRSFGNMNEYFSKKLTLKRSFCDLTDTDTITGIDTNIEIGDRNTNDNNTNKNPLLQKGKICQDNTVSCKGTICPQITTTWPVRFTYGDILKDSQSITTWGGGVSLRASLFLMTVISPIFRASMQLIRIH